MKGYIFDIGYRSAHTPKLAKDAKDKEANLI